MTVNAIDILKCQSEFGKSTPNLQFLGLLSDNFAVLGRIQDSPCDCYNDHGTHPTKGYQARIQILNVFVLNYLWNIICLGKSQFIWRSK